VNRPATLEADSAVQTVQDNLLDFGDRFFAHGSAFACSGAESSRPASTPAKIRLPDPQEKTHSPVAKEWHEMGDHSILVEAVCWPDLEPSLAALPEMADSGPMPETKDRLLCLREAAPPSRGSQPARAIEVARTEYRPTGAVLDYIIILSQTGDYQFQSDTTYYVLHGYFSGHVIFWNRAVLKFEPGAWLLLYGTVECHGAGSIENTALLREMTIC
jgi:hypothetical protein